jgi:peroxiredoxin
MTFGFASSYIALWTWAIFQGLLTLAVFRQVLTLEKRSAKWRELGGEGLPVGSTAPEFSGVDIHTGQLKNLTSFHGRPGVILFLAAQCSVCRQLAKSLQSTLPNSLPPLLAVCVGNEEEGAKMGKQLGSHIPLLVQEAAEVAELYRVFSYPIVVVVDGERSILAYTGVGSAEHLRQIVARSQGGYRVSEELAIAGTDLRQQA